MNEISFNRTAHFPNQTIIARMSAMAGEDFYKTRMTVLGLGNGVSQEGLAAFVASEGGCCGLRRNFRSQLACPSV
jgi:hypothetical protein